MVQKGYCRSVLECNQSIRFVSIVSKSGKLETMEYRKDVEPLLSEKELIVSVVLSVIRMRSRKSLQKKLGKIVCSLSLYKKVALATIPLRNNSYLMVSFDRLGQDNDNQQSIIESEILPILEDRERALKVE